MDKLKTEIKHRVEEVNRLRAGNVEDLDIAIKIVKLLGEIEGLSLSLKFREEDGGWLIAWLEQQAAESDRWGGSTYLTRAETFRAVAAKIREEGSYD